MMHTQTGSKKIPGRKKFLFSLIMVFGTLFSALVIAEVILRVVPIPGIRFSINHFDTLTGVSYFPGVTVNYRNDRGDHLSTGASVHTLITN